MMENKDQTIGEICDSVDGVIRTGPFGSQLHESDYSHHGIPVVMPKNIVAGRILTDGIARVAPEHVERLSKHKLIAGDIVFGRRGEIGRQALVNSEQEGWLCGTGCIRLSLGNKIVKPLYLHYYLCHPDVINWISNQAIGATLPNLNTSIMRSVPINVPRHITQDKIISILSAYDDLIENNLRRIKILEEMAQNLYREWFVNFRFPGHEKARFVDSPLGRIPEGWSCGVINDLFKLYSGYPFKSNDFVKPAKYAMVTIKNVKDGVFLYDIEGQIAELPSNMSSHCILYTGDILISLTGNVGRTCLVFGGDYLLNQRVAKIVPHVKYNHSYVYLMCRQKDFQKRLENIASGVAQQNLSPINMGNMEVVVPAEKLLQIFALYTENIIELILKRYLQNKALRQTRDLLLPKLISGEVDVSELDISVPEEAAS
jgi:type I restriction enzyme, S subunit